jgi:prepilin-type N-terminal cleavage/methylation domain-containing protein/prepilin-type processing-associated H-X9-DG protein
MFRNKKAFTLIELLVVIAIIAILAAILFPVFAKAREKARQAACLSNMKQIGLAMIMYTEDYDECFPVSFNQGLSTADPDCIMQKIQPYIKNTNVFVCPSPAKWDFASMWSTWYGGVDNNLYPLNPGGSFANFDLLYPGYNTWVTPPYTSYAWNGAVFETPLATGAPAPVTDASVGSPASIIAGYDYGSTQNMEFQFPYRFGTGETPGYVGKYFGWNYFYAINAFVAWGGTGQMYATHNGGANFVFMDGHAKWMLPTALTTGMFGLVPSTDTIGANYMNFYSVNLSQ